MFLAPRLIIALDTGIIHIVYTRRFFFFSTFFHCFFQLNNREKTKWLSRKMHGNPWKKVSLHGKRCAFRNTRTDRYVNNNFCNIVTFSFRLEKFHDLFFFPRITHVSTTERTAVISDRTTHFQGLSFFWILSNHRLANMWMIFDKHLNFDITSNTIFFSQTTSVSAYQRYYSSFEKYSYFQRKLEKFNEKSSRKRQPYFSLSNWIFPQSPFSRPIKWALASREKKGGRFRSKGKEGGQGPI